MNRLLAIIPPVGVVLILLAAMLAIVMPLASILVPGVEAREPCYRPEMMGTECPRPVPLAPAYCPFPQ